MSIFVEDKDIKEVKVENEIIKLRPLTLGEGNAIMKECSKFDPISGSFEMDSQKLGEMRLQKMIVEWTCKDKDGNKLPITLENVQNIKEEVSGKLLIESRKMAGVPKELGKKLEQL